MKKLLLLSCFAYFAVSCNQAPASTALNTLNHPDDTASLTKDKSDTGASTLDELTSSHGNFKLLLDNKYVRVLEYHLDPGQKDKPHTHPAKSSYVVTGGKLKVYLEDGSNIIADEEAGTASWSEAVGKHYVENVGTTPVTIILTEINSLAN